MSKFELGIEAVRAPKKQHASKKIGSTETWLRRMAPLIWEALYKDWEIEVKRLAEELGSKSSNYASTALQSGHKKDGEKPSGAGCFLSHGVPVKVRLVRENAANLRPYMDDDAIEALLGKLGCEWDELQAKFESLPSAVELQAKADKNFDEAVDELMS